VKGRQGSGCATAVHPLLTSRSRVYRGLGTFCFGIGAVGIGVPLLPTIPFWILAAFFYARSSPALRDRIYRHPRFGKPVRDFLEQGALSRRGKLAAVSGIVFGLTLGLLAFSPPVPLLAVLIVALTPVIAFLLTRPEPSREPRQMTLT
jgi:uncharacterized membrane protein YbaN (DUF454 family)